MAEPWENDPDNLLEISFQYDHAQREQACTAVVRAIAELTTGYPQNPKADAKLRERANRVLKAFADRSPLEAAIAEFLTREAAERKRRDAEQNSVSVGTALDKATNLTRQTAELQAHIGRMMQMLRATETNDHGDKAEEMLGEAALNAAEGWRHLSLAVEALKAAVGHFPVAPRGRGGALGNLSFSADVALLDKLEKLWAVNGLSIGSGRSGDGLDVILQHALAADDPKRVSGGKWFDKLREKAKRERAKYATIIQVV